MVPPRLGSGGQPGTMLIPGAKGKNGFPVRAVRRTFQISAQFQDTYGYPELTDALKRKVFGQNAAALYGVDPVTAKCTANDSALEEYRAALAPKQSYGPGSYAEAAKVIAAHGMRY